MRQVPEAISLYEQQIAHLRDGLPELEEAIFWLDRELSPTLKAINLGARVAVVDYGGMPTLKVGMIVDKFADLEPVMAVIGKHPSWSLLPDDEWTWIQVLDGKVQWYFGTPERTWLVLQVRPWCQSCWKAKEREMDEGMQRLGIKPAG